VPFLTVSGPGRAAVIVLQIEPRLRTRPAAPPLLKTRRHMRRDAARKLWRKLQEQGWRQVKAQWGADMDV